MRFTILVVHRRGGKTLLAIMKLIDSALRSDRPMSRFGYIAPQLKQAKGIAWDYLKSYARKIPGTQINESELWVKFPNGASIRLFGADNPDSFRGFYFDGVVLDEVAQMPLNIWGEILLPALADRQGWALFIGTPHGINLFSQLYYAAEADKEWFAKTYDYLATKALPDEEIERMRKDMTPNQFRQEMLCDFMASDDDTLIPLEDVIAAERRIILPQQIDYAPRIISVDVAWTGGDRCVAFRRQGLVAYDPLIEHGLPEKQFAGKIASIWETFKADACFVDVTGGYGGEVCSRLRDLGYNPVPVNFASKASDVKFLNLRAEMWFKMAAWMKEGKIPVSSALKAELCAPRYSNDNASNRLQLESKDRIKERLGASPDLADALAIGFAHPVKKKQPFTNIHTGVPRGDYDPVNGNEMVGDYDPNDRQPRKVWVQPIFPEKLD